MNKSFLVLTSGLVFLSGLANVSAQSTTPNTTGAEHNKTENHSEAKKNLACQNIVSECKKLGFIVGEYKTDNGLWKDCFYPILNGKPVTQKGKTIQVPVNPGDVKICKEANHKHDDNKDHHVQNHDGVASQPQNNTAPSAVKQ